MARRSRPSLQSRSTAGRSRRVADTPAEAQERAKPGLVKTVVYSLLPALLLLALVEGGARVWLLFRPPIPVDVGQGFTGRIPLFVPDPTNFDYRITHPQKRVSFQTQRFLAQKPEGTLRIAALGESSVNYLDYEFSVWPDRIQPQMPQYDDIEIINCGGLSYGSHRLTLVAQEVLAYEPDVLMIYMGHNEFEELEQLQLANIKAATLQTTAEKLGIFVLMRDIQARRRIAGLEEAKEERMLADSVPDTSRAWGHEFTPAEVAERMDNFQRNLTNIIRMAKEQGVFVVIGTVPSNLIKPSLPGVDPQQWAEVEAMYARGAWDAGKKRAMEILMHTIRHQSSDKENGIIRSVAAAEEVPLADVEQAVTDAEPNHVPGQTLFSDHCHLNPQGNRILVDTYEPIIVQHFSGAKP
ncbi:MAG: SGNH/GDSL hydrolase family protein [Candidatus Hydrogenedens sp.]|nr:SGNH/GDSL hydrolase family protein [Candidatus Hydrogenedens sp.]